MDHIMQMADYGNGLVNQDDAAISEEDWIRFMNFAATSSSHPVAVPATDDPQQQLDGQSRLVYPDENRDANTKASLITFANEGALLDFIARLPEEVLAECRLNQPLRSCINCNTQTTPFWRKAPSQPGLYVCNACGLYYRAHGYHRPVQFKAVDKPIPVRPLMVCADCACIDTPLWRRNSEGQTVCNACGLRARHRKNSLNGSPGGRVSPYPTGTPPPSG